MLVFRAIAGLLINYYKTRKNMQIMYVLPFMFAKSRTAKEKVLIELRKYFYNKYLMALKLLEHL